MVKVQHIIFFIEAWLSILLNIGGVYLLVTQKTIKVSHILLIHLSCLEIINTIANISSGYYRFILGIIEPVEISMVGVPFYVGQMVAIILVTIDRVIVVYWNIKYHIHVTKRRLAYTLLLIWSLLLLYGIFLAYFWSRLLLTISFLSCTISVVVIFILGYVYIALKVLYGRNTIGANPQQKLKWKVPFFLVLSFVLLILVPEFLSLHKPIPIDILVVVVYINYLLDPVVYIFGLKSTRTRMLSYWCNKNSSVLTKVLRRVSVVGIPLYQPTGTNN